MAFFDSVVNRTQAGAPRQPQAPGAPPAVSRPRTSVNPPGVATNPVGRPPIMGGPQGPALPLAPTQARPQPTGGPQGPAERPGIAPPRPGAGTGTSAAPAAPPQGAAMQGATPGGFSISLDRVPGRGELAMMAPGTEVMTPYGSVSRDGSLSLSEEGKVRYQEAVAQRRQRFGPHPFAGNPDVPPIPVTLGRPMFNPFTGQWMDRPKGW